MAVVRSAEVPLAVVCHRETERRQLHPHGLPLSDEAPYDTNLVCLNPGHLPAFVTDVGAEFFANRYSIGIWFFETNRVGVSVRSTARLFDELWVSSAYVREALEREVEIPVRVFPLPMESPTGPFKSRAELGLADGFTFLFLFDFWSEQRKNPAGVVEAFTRAFAPGEGPMLVVKSIHGDAKRRKLDTLQAVAGDRSDIVIRDGYVASATRDSFLAACDCYVSLHRSEGLGLTMAEAMALGKPVIATGYSGNLEFMDERNSYLVPYELVDLPTNWWAYAPGATWAEPDVAAAAELMRRAWESSDEARALGLRARDDLLGRFTLRRTADFVERRLECLRADGAIEARTTGRDARAAIAEASQGLAADVGARLVDDRSTRRASFVGRALRRALWPYLEEQRRVDGALLDAVTSLQRSIQDLERRIHPSRGAPPAERARSRLVPLRRHSSAARAVLWSRRK